LNIWLPKRKTGKRIPSRAVPELLAISPTYKIFYMDFTSSCLTESGIESLVGRDVRRALEMFVSIIMSGHLSPSAITSINLSRAVVHQHVGEMKTEASQKPVPMDRALANALLEWSAQTPYRQPEDWVFASPKMNGKQPYWPETMLKCYVQPISKYLGITKKIGWHTFRRTFATLLTGSNENTKTTQELMRHANAGITMNLYAQALRPRNVQHI